jgi:hypothetical protein
MCAPPMPLINTERHAWIPVDLYYTRAVSTSTTIVRTSTTQPDTSIELRVGGVQRHACTHVQQQLMQLFHEGKGDMHC